MAPQRVWRSRCEMSPSEGCLGECHARDGWRWYVFDHVIQRLTRVDENCASNLGLFCASVGRCLRGRGSWLTASGRWLGIARRGDVDVGRVGFAGEVGVMGSTAEHSAR